MENGNRVEIIDGSPVTFSINEDPASEDKNYYKNVIKRALELVWK